MYTVGAQRKPFAAMWKMLESTERVQEVLDRLHADPDPTVRLALHPTDDQGGGGWHPQQTTHIGMAGGEGMTERGKPECKEEWSHTGVVRCPRLNFPWMLQMSRVQQTLTSAKAPLQLPLEWHTRSAEMLLTSF